MARIVELVMWAFLAGFVLLIVVTFIAQNLGGAERGVMRRAGD